MISVRRGFFYIRAFFSSSYFAMTMFALCLCAMMTYMVYRTNYLCIIDNGKAMYQITTATSSGDILKANNVELREEDNVQFTGFDGKYGELVIDRAFPVSVTADGTTQEVYVRDQTVGQLLDSLDIQVKDEDILNKENVSMVTEGDEIVLQRVDYATRVDTKEIPNETIVKPSSLILTGSQKVLEEGKPGVEKTTIAEKYVDGQLVEETVVDSKVAESPENQVILAGVQKMDSPIEPWDDLTFDTTGRPQNYSRVLTKKTATAYTASPGANTSTGRKAAVGYVAVNPKVIPYGTRLYIETADGSYVYGYAVAADTGGALMSGAADVDLFFSTVEECRWFGRRSVNIYILD